MQDTSCTPINISININTNKKENTNIIVDIKQDSSNVILNYENKNVKMNYLRNVRRHVPCTY